MKKIFIVVIIIAIGVFASYFIGIGTKNAENNTNEKIEESSNKMEEIAELENEQTQENEEIVQEEINESQVENSQVIEKKNETKNEQVIQQNEVVESKKSNKQLNQTKKQESNKSTQPSIKNDSKNTSTKKNTDQPKQKTQKNETVTQQEKIYCTDGGKTHIAGDGANEHGYYKTWDEAFNAYEKYTEGWESSHFKINQCFCGLYYFYVTK